MKKFKELKEKAKETVKGLQESFGEIEEQYSDEDKQRELTNLHKLVMESESILNDWENKSDEVAGAIQKLKEYRDNKPVIWNSYNNRTKSVENPGGWATHLLSNLKARTKKTGESTWGFKLQEFSFAKESKEALDSEEKFTSESQEVKQQLAVEEIEVEIKENKEKLEVASKFYSLDYLKKSKENLGDSIKITTATIEKSAIELQDSTLGAVSSKIEETGEWAMEEAERAEKAVKNTEVWKKMSEGWNWLKEKLEKHEIGEEKDIKLKYRINEIQTKPEARLWLAHLLHPIHGEISRIDIKNEISKEKIEKLKKEQSFQELEQYIDKHNITNVSLTTDGEDLIFKYNDKETKIITFEESDELVKKWFKNAKEDKKVIHGIIVAKKDKEGKLTKRFFKLEGEYENEKELHKDTYPIMWRTLIKGGVDKMTISEDRMERILKDKITSDLSSLNFLGFKKDTVESFASGLARTSQALNVSKWLTNNSFLILTDLLNRWDSYILGHADTPPAFNIRTALAYSLIYESKIIDKWKEEFEKACYELENKSAELSINELSEYTAEQKNKIAEEIIKKRFKKIKKQNKERSFDLLKITGKAQKLLTGEAEEKKLLEVVSENLKVLVAKTWEEKGTRKLRSEINNMFGELSKESKSINDITPELVSKIILKQIGIKPEEKDKIIEVYVKVYDVLTETMNTVHSAREEILDKTESLLKEMKQENLLGILRKKRNKIGKLVVKKEAQIDTTSMSISVKPLSNIKLVGNKKQEKSLEELHKEAVELERIVKEEEKNKKISENIEIRELERLQKEEKHFQKQIERLKEKLELVEVDEIKKSQYKNKLQEFESELKDRQSRIKQQEEKLVAQIESK